MFLNNEQIKNIIPHRTPMLMIDSVSDLVPGISITAENHFSETWEIYRGHFPSKPVTPGIYLIESMAQAADIMLLSLPENSGKTPFLVGISRIRFMRSVLPGDNIVIRAELSQTGGGGLYECSASVSVDGKKAASGLITLALK